jgi:hypothetical protein
MGGKKIRAKKKEVIIESTSSKVQNTSGLTSEKSYTTWKQWLKDNLDMDVI